MKCMSFKDTVNAIKNGDQRVTRRIGWDYLIEGDKIMAVVQNQGLRKGEKFEKLRVIEVVGVTRERLVNITKEDVEAEGFPDMTVQEFIRYFTGKYGIQPWEYVNRIVFKYPDIDEVGLWSANGS